MERETFTSVMDAICRNGIKHPDRLCAADKKTALSYGQLFSGIRRGAAYLRDQGVRRGDIVLLRARQDTDFITAFYSVQFLNAIVCPIEKTAADARILEIAKELKTAWYLDRSPNPLPGLKLLDLRALMSCDSELDSGEYRVEETGPEDITNIIYTTGTTGKSKGILVSRRADLAIAENVHDSVSMEEDEVELITTPLSHSLAVRRMNAAMVKGSSVVVSDKFVFVDSFYRLLDRYHVTAVTSVPAILRGILESSGDRLASYDRSLRYIQLGSAPLHEAEKNRLMELLPHVRLYNTYGATESGCTIILEFSRYRNRKNCIGRTTVHTRLFFVDENRNPVDARDERTAARMAFAGDMNMSGYANAPDLTAEVLADGCIYTSDIGYQGEDGLIYILGREGDIINMGGLKINPLEVEEAAEQCPGIRDCACIPGEDPLLGEIPVLYVSMEEGSEMDPGTIRAFIGKRLEEYKVPRTILRIPEIPRTFNGKINRKELKDAQNNQHR